jgi:hypothetical protein
MMYRPDYLTQIEKRISDAPLGQVFITSDFLDIADTSAGLWIICFITALGPTTWRSKAEPVFQKAST